jgi:hypothetical protein
MKIRIGMLALSDNIIFSEFIEALAKLATISMFNSKNLTDLKKIRLIYNFVIDQDPEVFICICTYVCVCV